MKFAFPKNTNRVYFVWQSGDLNIPMIKKRTLGAYPYMEPSDNAVNGSENHALNAAINTSAVQSETVNPVSLYIAAESIYRHSTVRITIQGEQPFEVRLPGQVLTLEAGKRNSASPGWVCSTDKDAKHRVIAELLECMSEKKIRKASGTGPDSSYGMRYYPFVSAILQGDIEIRNGHISSIIVELPDTFRLIWYGARVVGADGHVAKLDHSYGPARSKYLFTWDAETIQKQIKLAIPIRHSGNRMLELVSFPLYYFLLALAAVGLSSIAEKPGIVMGAVVAAWGFMLKKWSTSNLPQRNTILTLVYLIAGGTVFLWGLAWVLFQSWAILGLIVILPFVELCRRANKSYSAEGQLPFGIEEFWSKRVRLSDTSQRSTWSVESSQEQLTSQVNSKDDKIE